MAPVNGIFPSIANDQYNNAMSSLKQVLATMNSSLMPSSSLKITSPASGATLTEGQTYPIRWTGGSGNYNVYVNCTNAPIGDEGYVGSVKASDGVFQWTVGNFSEITTSANCRLNFLYPSNNLPVAYSNYFNIFASQPQSGITVIAPVGGEVLTENSKAVGSLSSVDSQNQIFEIKWTGAPDSSSDVYGDNAGNPSRIAAYLEQNGNVIGRIIPEGYGSIFWIVGEVSNTNCINCMVGNGSCPSSTSASSCYSSIRLVAPGTYNVKIVDTQTGAFGRSRPFTLVAQKSCTPNWQCTAWSACGVNAQQTRTCSDTNNCGFTVGKPALSQSCGSTPTITVTSPTGGSYTNGQNIVISYTASGLDSSKQYIALITMRHPGDNCPGPNCIGGSFSLAQPCYTGSCTNVPVTNGNNSISLSIPYTLSQSSGIYQVNFSVIDLATLGQEGATAVASTIGSGLITVSRSSTYVTPTITITSPGAGAQWVQGSTHNITWTSTNLPANEQVTIMALDYNDNASARQDISIASGVPASQGTYSWTVPTNVLGNKFDMQISGPDVAGLQVSGPAGNNATGFLSIVAPTTSMNVSQSSLASISSALQAVLQGIKQLTGQ